MAKDIDKSIDVLNKLKSGELLNPVLLTVHQQIKKRIFSGQDANGRSLGTYSDAYMRRRIKRGLGSNRKVILEFTGQMRRDFVPIKRNGQIVGSGFKNQFNDKKATWVEKQFKRDIFSMSRTERELMTKLLQKQIDRLL